MSRRAELEEKARHIGRLIGTACPEGAGFCLMLFDLGKGKHGEMTYISNANRVDMLKCVRELLEVVEEGRDLPPKVDIQ